MRQRSVSSIGVVVVGLVPALVGGLTFAIVCTTIFVLAFTELATMLKIDSRAFQVMGCALIVIAGGLAWFADENAGLPVLVGASVLLPLVLAIFSSGTTVIEQWSRTVAASVSIAVPAFAAVSLRELDGDSVGLLESLSGALDPGGAGTGRGLGWFLMALLVTWLSDTGAYLVGKRIGRRKLIPRVSPNKTVEGAVGGLACAAVTALACSQIFRLDIAPWLAILLGIVLGAVGMLGDLAESVLKRQSGVKDSGTLIPGHGGLLDRIDALLFTLVATWVLIPLLY